MAYISKEITAKLGMTCAVVLQYIAHWVEVNTHEDRNFEDGRYWTYNTQAQIADDLGISKYQVNRCLKKLVEEGYLLAQNLNRTKQDRMLWYALSDIAISVLYPYEEATKKASSKGISEEKTKTATSNCKSATSNCKSATCSSNSIYINNNMHHKQHHIQHNSASPTPSNASVDETESPTAKSAAEAQTRTQGNCPFFDILKAYNEICTSYPRMSVLDNERRRAILKLWKQYGSLDFFTRVFRKAEASAYLKGTNDRKWHADFDWIVKPSNFAKILEGRFDVLYERKQAQSAPIQSNRLTNPSFEISDIERIYAQAFNIDTSNSNRKAAEA